MSSLTWLRIGVVGTVGTVCIALVGMSSIRDPAFMVACFVVTGVCFPMAIICLTVGVYMENAADAKEAAAAAKRRDECFVAAHAALESVLSWDVKARHIGCETDRPGLPDGIRTMCQLARSELKKGHG